MGKTQPTVHHWIDEESRLGVIRRGDRVQIVRFGFGRLEGKRIGESFLRDGQMEMYIYYGTRFDTAGKEIGKMRFQHEVEARLRRFRILNSLVHSLLEIKAPKDLIRDVVARVDDARPMKCTIEPNEILTLE